MKSSEASPRLRKIFRYGNFLWSCKQKDKKCWNLKSFHNERVKMFVFVHLFRFYADNRNIRSGRIQNPFSSVFFGKLMWNQKIHSQLWCQWILAETFQRKFHVQPLKLWSVVTAGKWYLFDWIFHSFYYVFFSVSFVFTLATQNFLLITFFFSRSLRCRRKKSEHKTTVLKNAWTLNPLGDAGVWITSHRNMIHVKSMNLRQSEMARKNRRKIDNPRTVSLSLSLSHPPSFSSFMFLLLLCTMKSQHLNGNNPLWCCSLLRPSIFYDFILW